MKFARIASLVLSCSLVIACSDPGASSDHADSAGGQGGNGAMGGSGSQGGAAGSGGSGTSARPCVTTSDCAGGRNSNDCSVDICVDGYCTWIHDSFGVLCGGGSGTYLICDGLGHCGEWMPADTETCYVPTKLTPKCPLCDDGDPATNDWCLEGQDGAPDYCENTVVSEGMPCGFRYIMIDGQCCPY